MKRMFLFAVLALAFSAGAATAHEKISHVLSGMIEGIPNGTKVYIGVQTRSGFQAIDSSTVKDNKFAIAFSQEKGVKECDLGIRMGNKFANITDILLENADIQVNISKSGDVTVNGGAENKLMNEYKSIGFSYRQKMMPYYKTAVDSTKTKDERLKAREEFDKLQKEQFGDIAKFIKANVPSGVSSLLMGYYAQTLDDITLDDILAEMKVKCPTDETFLRLQKKRELDGKVAVGQKYTDIALPNPEGKIIKVSDFVKKSKFVLIDFWAFWCGPCRAEMPNLINAYNAYKDKGFAIVGVSLDGDANAWKDAIEKLGIPWPQMSDLKGWRSEGAALYNLNAIPATVLIDQDGKIIAKNLRGEKLMNKLKEIFM